MAEDLVPFKVVGVRLPEDVIEIIDARAAALNLTKTDFVRAAIHRQLTEYPLTEAEADRYRRPPDQRGRREFASAYWKGE